jgi:flagellar M-ring protein FliF
MGEGDGASGLLEMRRGVETRLARAVEDMLERTLGPGRVRAEASVDFDTGQIHQTEEKYDPEGKVERSTQNVSDSTKSTEAPQTVSVQNNLPNADAAAPGAGSQQQRTEETTNYEIGKTVRTLVREQPEVRRISLAVLVDGTETVAADGAKTYAARSPEELDRIAALVRGAIGFDEKRGDKVEVVNLRFVAPEEPAPPMVHRFLGFEVANPDVMRLAQTGLIGLLALFGLIFVLRPMVHRLSLSGETALALAGGGVVGADGLMVTGDVAGGTGGGAGGALAAGERMLALTHDGSGGGAEDDSMVDVTNVDGQLRAASMRKIIEMVDQHPDESLAILRGWMQQEPT